MPRSSSTMRVVTRSRNARSWVMTIAGGHLSSSSSSRSMPSMSRWLVGSSSSSRSGCNASASASAARLRSPPELVARVALGVEIKAVQEFRQPRLQAPALALVCVQLGVHRPLAPVALLRVSRLSRRVRLAAARLLLDECDSQAVATAAARRRRAAPALR